MKWVVLLNSLWALAQVCKAEKVLEVRGTIYDQLTLSHPEQGLWRLEDHFCVKKKRIDIACGKIISVKNTSAEGIVDFQKKNYKKKIVDNRAIMLVELKVLTQYPRVGDKVQMTSRSPKKEINGLVRELSSATYFGGNTLESKQNYFPVSAFDPRSNLTIGMNYVFPTMEYQQILGFHSSIGVMPIYMDYPVDDGFLRGLGGFVQYHYYTEERFRGYWGKLGFGFYKLDSGLRGIQENRISPAVMATFGRRWFWNPHFNFGFAVGGQFLFNAVSNQTDLKFNGFVPSIALDVGYSF